LCGVAGGGLVLSDPQLHERGVVVEREEIQLIEGEADTLGRDEDPETGVLFEASIA